MAQTAEPKDLEAIREQLIKSEEFCKAWNKAMQTGFQNLAKKLSGEELKKLEKKR
mgnify:CR=1 FL=1